MIGAITNTFYNNLTSINIYQIVGRKWRHPLVILCSEYTGFGLEMLRNENIQKIRRLLNGHVLDWKRRAI